MSDWYDSLYSSLSFRVPGEYLAVLLFIWTCSLRLVRLVILVAKVIADIKVQWKSLMFLIILLQLALLVAFSITCVVFLCNSLNLCCYLFHNGYCQDDYHD